ncbi:peptidylprolyl isomerase [Lysobacter arseniciresistens ZS79]|uniref:Periplasmic chaperone PpiD n=1 Tax=Lysobacter arseniciresistens ZS79 TaxID=913325 RepID=A0A0A0F6W8_9GAMM|nr:peptidyl-prolyl cis-trans isomerase [Lysobacter arseniciresistens]KGM57127.1 peptidylprolyl isomerase [Lysobacter arseniciresistens ZS79]
MLQKLRDKTSGWIATVILGLLIVPFAFFGLEQYMVQRSNTTVATIQAPPTWWAGAPSFWPVSVFWRHEEINVDEFRQRFEQVRQQQRAELGDAFDAREFESVENKRLVLETLIDQRVQAMAAEQAGVVVSDAMVRDAIQAIPAFQVDGRFDPQRYQLALASQVPAQSPAQFDQLVREGLQQSLVSTAIANSNFVTDAELDRLIRLMGERRDVSLMVVPPPATDPAAAPAAAEVQAWYEAHLEDYRAPERVAIEYIELDMSALPAPQPADEATLRARYQEEQDKFASQEQRLASHILIEVPADADAAAQQAAQAEAAKVAGLARAEGADFAALAAEYSDDTGSSTAGGDLGWISRDMMPGPFSEALFALEPGQVSEPVKSDFGWHVIQLREVKAGASESFEQVRETLAAEQAEADREQAFNDISSQVVDAVLANPGALAPAAEVAGVQVQKLGPFPRDASDGLAANPALRQAAFSDVLIEDGTVSDPIEIAPGRTAWIRVTEHLPAAARPLAEVREQVVADLRSDRARTAARERADALLAKLDGGTTLAALAEAESLPAPQSVPGVPRGAPLIDESVSQAIFATRPAADGKPAHGVRILDDGTIVLFAVEKVVPGDVAEVPAAQREMLAGQIAQFAGMNDVQALVSALRAGMKIEVVEANL